MEAVSAELLSLVPRVETVDEETVTARAHEVQQQQVDECSVAGSVVGSVTGSVSSQQSTASLISQASSYSHVFIRSGHVGRKIAQEVALQRLADDCFCTGQQSLFEACRRNNVSRVKEILKTHPFATNMLDFGGNTPVQVACMLRSYECVQALLESGADILKADPIGVAPLDYIKETVEKVKLQRFADGFAKDEEDFLDDDSTVQGPTNVIRDAAYRGDMQLIDSLLQQDASLLHAVDKKGHTPLIFACMGQQVDTACYLLERGADLYATTTYGWQAARFVRDRIKQEKILLFAFKVSPEGRAQAALALQKRKDELRMAVGDSTNVVMEAVRGVIYVRERRIRERAEALTSFALDRAEHYLVVGELRAVEHSIRDFMDDMERQEEAERLRHIAEEEERVRQRDAFVAASVAAVMAQRAALEAERQERQRLRLLAEEEAERLRMRLEIAAKLKRDKQQQLLDAETHRAEEDWATMEAHERATALAAFRRTRPLRVLVYRRMLNSTREGVASAKLPEVPLAGMGSVKEEMRLARSYRTIEGLFKMSQQQQKKKDRERARKMEERERERRPATQSDNDDEST